MTPLDEDRFMSKLGRLIDTKIAPIVKRIENLENVDKKHDHIIKDTRRELTQSNHDITVSTTETLLAAARHNAAATARLEEKIDGIEAAQSGSIVPAAQGAERAAHRAEGKIDATQVAADRADSQSLSAKRWARFGPIIAIVQTILTILYHVLVSK